MSVNLDTTTDDYDRSNLTTLSNQTTRLEDCEDEETIKKTQSIPMPKPNHSNKVLTGSVEPISDTTVSEDVEKLEELLEAVVEEKEKNENQEPSENYLIKICNLVAQILVQINRISQKDNKQIEELKTKYRTSTLDSANKRREFGSHQLKYAMISFGASFLQFLSPHQSDRDIANIIAKELCPKLGDMFGSGIQANMEQSNSVASLLLQEYTTKTQKEQSSGNYKQMCEGTIEKATNVFSQAARAG